jgi:outer membrane protein assembly factor BamB
VDWQRSVLDSGPEKGLVADGERVYAAGGGLVALDRNDGTTDWERDVVGGPLGVHRKTVVTAPAATDPPGAGGAVHAVLADDGTMRWSADVVEDTRSLLVGERTVVVGGERGLVAIETGGGNTLWMDPAGSPRGAFPLLVRFALYAGGDGVTEFATRSLADAATGASPGRAWTADVGTVTAVATTERYLLAGTAAAGLVCFNRRERTTEWTALDEERPATVDALAIDGDRCFVGVRRDGPAVVGFDLRNGNRFVREPLDGRVSDLVVVDGEVVVATDADTVRSLGRKPGRQRWRVELFEVDKLAPVDGTIFAVTDGGTVAAIRD